MAIDIELESANTVDIITRTKDRSKLLSRSINSVLEQTHQNWRHIIVNDGGEPRMVEDVVEQYAQRYGGRMTLIHNGHSHGMEAASNIGIRAGTGKYIAIHDDDDSWRPEFLRSSVDSLEECKFESVRGVVCHTTQIHEKIQGDEVVELRRQDLTPGLASISIPQILEINRFMPIAFLFERSVLDAIGLFDESLPVIGDWDFNVRFFMKYDVIVLQDNLANYHVRQDTGGNLPNSVTSEPQQHLFYRSLIVNRHIRSDIESDRITAGMLFAAGDHFYRAGVGVARIDGILEKLKRLPLIWTIRKVMRM